MADDVKPAPAVQFAYSICELAELEPQDLFGYVVVYTDTSGQVGAYCSGVDRMATIALLAAGVLNISQDTSPELVITIEPT